MDKAEYQVKLDQLKALVAEQDYDGALEIVQVIDWRRVKNIRTLCMVADVYEANDMLEDCRRILLLALKRASIGKSILSRLVELCLMMNDTAAASGYYREFVKAAPRDAARYLLQYKILKANQSSVEEQIEALHDYKDSEYTERWAYELASLYDKAGRVEECVEECDDIILWFSEGVYVVKAMELKMKHTALTPSQQNKYDHRLETMPELLEPEMPRFVKKKKPVEEPIVVETPAAEPVMEDVAAAAETIQDVKEPEATTEEKEETDFVATMDLEKRLSLGIKRVIGSILRDDDDEPEDEEAEADELFAKVEDERFAPQLEPEQPAESGIRRDQTVTKPETMKAEEEVSGDTFDFSAMFEAQADAFAAGEVPVQSEEMPVAQEEAPEKEPTDDFDLSKLLENEVADILKEKEAAKEPEIAVAEDVVEESVAEPMAEETAEPAFDLEEQLLKAVAVETDTTAEEIPAKTVDLREEMAAEKATIDLQEALAQELAQAMKTPETEEPEALDVAQESIIEETEDEFADLSEKVIEQIMEAPEAVEEAPAEEAKPEEPEEGEFDLQALLAAEVTDMIANPAEEPTGLEAPKVEKAEEEDLLTRLENEVASQTTAREPEKETPQEKRMRIMRATAPSSMTEEQKRVFTYFAKVPGMDTQILEAMNRSYNGAVSKTSRHGNIAIMGRKGTGKTRLSEGLIKALCKEFEMSAAKFARIHAKELNKKDVAQVVSKLAGGFLVIEKASMMSEETLLKLNQAMEFRTDSMILIIEDEKDDMKGLLEANPEFAEKFDAVIKIPVFTNDELVTFARTYAGECGYKMDEMGILALYTIIGANQSVDEPVSIAKVKEMVDAAIAKAGKGGRKIGRKLSGRQVDRMNRIILYEKDFEL